VALESAAGGRMFNVVVKNEKVSKELLNGRCLMQATTFIPLNKIDGRCISNDIVNNLKQFTGGRVWLARELVEYEPELEPAINYVFGSTFVAEDE
jgi:structural maintenance of chromosome 2